MSKLIKWEVSPVPTGMYKSFQKRNWPTGFIKNAKNRILLICDDEYIPANVKEGKHKEIKIKFDVFTEAYGSLKLVTLKKRASTLKEAKELAEKYFANHPEHIKFN